MTDPIKALIAAAKSMVVQIDGSLWLEQDTGFLHSLANNQRLHELRSAIAVAEARPEPKPDPMARDWTVDFAHENGNYENHCIVCAQKFYGDKRRTTCRVCAYPPARPEPTPDESGDFYAQLPKGPTHGRFSASDRADLDNLKRKAFEKARPEPAAEPIEGMPYQEAIEGARVATKMMTKMHPPNLQAFDIWVMDAVTYLRDAVEALAREVRK